MLQKQKVNIALDERLFEEAKIAIVRTDYHKELIDNLETYCHNTLKQYGVREKNIKVFTVPGSWEIPLLVQAAAKSKNFDAIITLGVIMRGETYHFDMIANECARALMQLSLDYSMPIAIEILAVNNIKQAKERTGKNIRNKGIEAAIAVLKSLSALKKI